VVQVWGVGHAAPLAACVVAGWLRVLALGVVFTFSVLDALGSEMSWGLLDAAQ
jgi:hypothetical protein